MKLAGVQPGDEIITQPLSFVATANSIAHCGAKPIFLDVERKTLGLDPTALKSFLQVHAHIRENTCYNKATGKRIAACVPMHTFGHPCRIDEIAEICNHYHIALVEDSAESLGSTYKGEHTGTFGLFGIYSFNGNKTVTCGGGGVIVTNDEALDIFFIHEPEHARSNYWLNAIILSDHKTRDKFLKVTNEAGVMTRPVWRLLNKLDMYKTCQTDALTNAKWLEELVVNIPSSVRI